jgi:hypothetical protein
VLILTPEQANAPKRPRLNYVLRELHRAFRPHRPRPVNPDSPRNLHDAMCSRCEWSRQFYDSKKASEAAIAHGQSAHGDPLMAFVRIEAR